MEENSIQTMTAEEIDGRIQEAVATARGEWERAQAETQRVAAMSQEERAGYELSRREAELAERERALVRRELKALAQEKLTERGLPAELADALNCESEAECLKGVDRLERAFRQAVQSAVDERLRGKAPGLGSAGRIDPENLSDEAYYRMNAKLGV